MHHTYKWLNTKSKWLNFRVIVIYQNTIKNCKVPIKPMVLTVLGGYFFGYQL